MGNKALEERLFLIEKQRVEVERFDCEGLILDVGGGGEGVIGQLFGNRVIAVDPIKNELEQAPEGPLKVIMDGKDLKFLDETFSTVTSFFTMMYIAVEDHKRVFSEIYRVMKPEGLFVLWDVTIPPFNQGEKDIFAVPLEIQLDDKVIKTGYGTIWAGREQDISYYIDLGKGTGFKVLSYEMNGKIFCLKFMK